MMMSDAHARANRLPPYDGGLVGMQENALTYADKVQRYLVIKKGEGEGCDYTIGCNMRYDIVEHNGTTEELHRKLVEEAVFNGERNHYEEFRIEVGSKELEIQEFMVVPLGAVINLLPDLKACRAAHNANMQKLKAEDKEVQERAHYEELRKKFE